MPFAITEAATLGITNLLSLINKVLSQDEQLNHRPISFLITLVADLVVTSFLHVQVFNFISTII